MAISGIVPVAAIMPVSPAGTYVGAAERVQSIVEQDSKTLELACGTRPNHTSKRRRADLKSRYFARGRTKNLTAKIPAEYVKGTSTL